MLQDISDKNVSPGLKTLLGKIRNAKSNTDLALVATQIVALPNNAVFILQKAIDEKSKAFQSTQDRSIETATSNIEEVHNISVESAHQTFDAISPGLIEAQESANAVSAKDNEDILQQRSKAFKDGPHDQESETSLSGLQRIQQHEKETFSLESMSKVELMRKKFEGQ